MVKNVVMNGYWDDELEQLVARVVELLGEDVIDAAVARASVALSTSAHSPMERVYGYRAAVKAELRRLITPQ